MQKLYFSLFTFIFLSFLPGPVVRAQGGVAVNTIGAPPDSSALFDLSSSSKGLLMPRLTTAQRNAIVKPATGLFVYNTDCNVVNYNAGTPTAPLWSTLNSSTSLIAGVSIAASPAGAICAGSSVTFSATPSQNNLSPSYQWQINGSNVGSNSSTYTTANLNSGDVVSCILTSSAACVTGSPANSNTITMLVNTVPTITGTTPASFCAGSAVTLGASASLGTINWYSVSTGGASLSTGASFTVSGLNATTTYYVDATANGCTTGSRTAVVATAYPSSPGQPGTITGPAATSADSSTSYSISALSNVASYSWVVSLGTITAGQGSTSINVTWNDTSGTGSVSVVANNPCGTSATQTLPVSIETETFSYTGGQQSFIVPAGVTQLTLAVYGAQGGSTTTNNTGGWGGSATGTLAVTPGNVLYIFVGGQPNGNAGGFNGGGLGYNNGTGGGGASDVRLGGADLGSRVIVAGGGGGTTYSWSCNGGSGGGTNGGTGSSSNGSIFDGQGGTQGGGGSVSSEDCGGSSGSLGQGGNGSSCDGDGGGGGGGYYGGGGSDAGGAGGGSGYIGGVTNGNMQNGVQAGNGYVTINW